MPEKFENIIIGGGPATASLGLALPEYLRKLSQTCFINAKPEDYFGVGNVGYEILSNSPPADALEILENFQKFDRVSGELRQRFENWQKDTDLQTPQRLTGVVRQIQRAKGELLKSLLQQSPENILHEALAKSAKLNENGIWEVSFTVREESQKILANNLILAIGGKDKPLLSELEPHKDKTCPSLEFLAGKHNKYIQEKCRNFLNQDQKIPCTIVGGSHSAYSSFLRILEIVAHIKNISFSQEEYTSSDFASTIKNILQYLDITLIAQKPRLFWDTDEPNRPKNPDPESICPETGRIHRFSGIRAASRALACVLQENRYFYTNLVERNSDQKNKVYENASFIIQAIGCQATPFPLYDANGNEITTTQGQFPQILDQTEKPIRNLVRFGLGATQRVPEGGKSIELDGINVYDRLAIEVWKHLYPDLVASS